MGKHLNNFNHKVKEIIKSFLNDPSWKEFGSEYNEPMIECIEKHYVRGIESYCTDNGTVHFLCPSRYVAVTKKGIEFLELRFPNLRANIALALSIIAILISLSTGVRTMYDNYIWLRSHIRESRPQEQHNVLQVDSDPDNDVYDRGDD